jgi:hypothetical protein
MYGENVAKFKGSNDNGVICRQQSLCDPLRLRLQLRCIGLVQQRNAARLSRDIL